MSLKGFQALSDLFCYPGSKEGVSAALSGLQKALEPLGAAPSLEPFARFVERSSLADLQEDYVAAFDFSPAIAPYLGHHLFGDQQKKAAYMIRIKEIYARQGFSFNENELPDHLMNLFAFLGQPAETIPLIDRREFIGSEVKPGLQKLATAFEPRAASPWRSLVDAALFLCNQECPETVPC